MPVTKRTRFEVLRRDGHRCRYCGAGAPDVELTIDHVLPVALGGTDKPENLVTACWDCNAGKAASAPDAELVAQVSGDAARWRDAIVAARSDLKGERAALEAEFVAFRDRWESWTFESRGETHLMNGPLPLNFVDRLEEYRGAGMTMHDLFAAVDDLEACFRSPRDPWAYFVGILNRRLAELHDRARAIIEGQD